MWFARKSKCRRGRGRDRDQSDRCRSRSRDVRSLADTLEDAAMAMETLTPSVPQISFVSPELRWKVLTAKRRAILKTLTGAGPVTIRAAARRVGRDVKAVHGDVRALLNAGLLDKTEDGKIVFPYDAIHIDFLLRAA